MHVDPCGDWVIGDWVIVANGDSLQQEAHNLQIGTHRSHYRLTAVQPIHDRRINSLAKEIVKRGSAHINRPDVHQGTVRELPFDIGARRSQKGTGSP
jgi:hypothetical protein